MHGGLFSQNGDFHIWMSADERKMPVRFEARVRLGRVLGVLKERQGNAMPKHSEVSNIHACSLFFKKNLPGAIL